MYLIYVSDSVKEPPSGNAHQKAKTTTAGLQMSASTSAQAKQTTSKVHGNKGYSIIQIFWPQF